MTALAKDDIKHRLKALDGWKLDDGELEKKYQFGDFVESMAFVNRVAVLAEEANHHPDISIKYNRVKLTLSTHDEGGITEKDFALIDRIDGMTASSGADRTESDGAPGG